VRQKKVAKPKDKRPRLPQGYKEDVSFSNNLDKRDANPTLLSAQLRQIHLEILSP